MAAFKIAQYIDLYSGGRPDIKQAYGHLGDKLAHEWEVTVVRGGAAMDLTGYTAMALCNNGAGTVQIAATITGNVVSALFPAACYAYEGTHECFMRITNSGATSETITATMYLVVTAAETDTAIDPGTGISTTLSGLLATEAARVAAEEDRADAETARAAFYDGFTSSLAGKADLVSSATNGNFAGLDADGNLTDSGSKAADFATVADAQTKAITDTGSYFTTDTVEAALQEVGSHLAASPYLDELKVNWASKNLINPKSVQRINDYYVYCEDGKKEALTGWSTFLIPIQDATHISMQGVGSHYSFTDRFIDLPSLPSAAVIPGWISGGGSYLADATLAGVSVPSGAKYLVFSCTTARVGSSAQVEYGATVTAWAPYSKVAPQKANITVGNGYDYETIAEAVAAASDGDTILVMPGTYVESVDIQSTGKFLKIKGFCRDSCILTYDSGNYDIAPLEIAKGVVEDLTIFATGTTLAEGASYRAYCVHIDYEQSINSSLQFKNVRFKNKLRQCVGIGLHENFRLSFVNCDFEADDVDCIYLHEQQASDKAGQYVEFVDCSMKRNSSGRVILLQETPANTGNEATLRIQRCVVVNGGDAVIIADQYGTQPGLNGAGYLGTSCWTLDTASKMNSDTSLNA